MEDDPREKTLVDNIAVYDHLRFVANSEVGTWPDSRHVGIDQRLWMYGPNQSPVDAGKKPVSWKLSGADSGRITDPPQRKYSIENSERALKCSAGFPEVDGKGAGDHARKSKKTALFVRMLPEMFSALQTLR